MEKIFNSTECPESKKVDQAVFYFRGKADLWWHNNKEPMREEVGKLGDEFG